MKSMNEDGFLQWFDMPMSDDSLGIELSATVTEWDITSIDVSGIL